MQIYDLLFIIQFLTVMGILLYKTYQLMNSENYIKGGVKPVTNKYGYDIKMAFILFIAYFIAWGVGMYIFMLRPEKLIY